MKKLASLILVTLSLSSLADVAEIFLESWRMGENYVVFVNLKNKGMRINKGCESTSDSCLVWKILAQVSMKELAPSDLLGGKNLGAALCHRQEKAQIVFARNAKGRQATFCQFSDGSMVDSGGILIAAKMNDAKVRDDR